MREGDMEKVSKILAPTDLSEVSCIGFGHALELARSRGAEVIVYHVIDNAHDWTGCEDFMSDCEMLARRKLMLDKFLREKLPVNVNIVEVRQVVELGSAASSIVEKAESERVDMIVMATHGRTGLHHLLVAGSVSAKVVSRAPCPVLVMPAPRREFATAA
jgi:universal stress protein A